MLQSGSVGGGRHKTHWGRAPDTWTPCTPRHAPRPPRPCLGASDSAPCVYSLDTGSSATTIYAPAYTQRFTLCTPVLHRFVDCASCIRSASSLVLSSPSTLQTALCSTLWPTPPCTSMPALHLLTLAGLVHVASGHGQLNFPPSTRQGLPGKTWPGALSGQGSGGYCEQPLSENPHNQLNGACMLFSQPSVKQPGISMIPVGGATLNDAKVRYWLATGWCRLGDVGGLSWEYTTCYSTATTSTAHTTHESCRVERVAPPTC